MVKFATEVAKNLPYDRKQYLDYYDPDLKNLDPAIHWYGVSMQLEAIQDQKLYLVCDDVVKKSTDLLNAAFKIIVFHLDPGQFWIVNHEDMDLKWFYESDGKLPALCGLFKDNNIAESFVGALTFSREELLRFSRDLIMYPYVLSYKTLDVSNSELPFIIKLTNHLTLDILSTEPKLIEKKAVTILLIISLRYGIGDDGILSGN